MDTLTDKPASLQAGEKSPVSAVPIPVSAITRITRSRASSVASATSKTAQVAQVASAVIVVKPTRISTLLATSVAKSDTGVKLVRKEITETVPPQGVTTTNMPHDEDLDSDSSELSDPPLSPLPSPKDSPLVDIGSTSCLPTLDDKTDALPLNKTCAVITRSRALTGAIQPTTVPILQVSTESTAVSSSSINANSRPVRAASNKPSQLIPRRKAKNSNPEGRNQYSLPRTSATASTSDAAGEKSAQSLSAQLNLQSNVKKGASANPQSNGSEARLVGDTIIVNTSKKTGTSSSKKVKLILKDDLPKKAMTSDTSKVMSARQQVVDPRLSKNIPSTTSQLSSTKPKTSHIGKAQSKESEAIDQIPGTKNNPASMHVEPALEVNGIPTSKPVDKSLLRCTRSSSALSSTIENRSEIAADVQTKAIVDNRGQARFQTLPQQKTVSKRQNDGVEAETSVESTSSKKLKSSLFNADRTSAVNQEFQNVSMNAPHRSLHVTQGFGLNPSLEQPLRRVSGRKIVSAYPRGATPNSVIQSSPKPIVESSKSHSKTASNSFEGSTSQAAIAMKVSEKQEEIADPQTSTLQTPQSRARRIHQQKQIADAPLNGKHPEGTGCQSSSGRSTQPLAQPNTAAIPKRTQSDAEIGSPGRNPTKSPDDQAEYHMKRQRAPETADGIRKLYQTGAQLAISPLPKTIQQEDYPSTRDQPNIAASMQSQARAIATIANPIAYSQVAHLQYSAQSSSPRTPNDFEAPQQQLRNASHGRIPSTTQSMHVEPSSPPTKNLKGQADALGLLQRFHFDLARDALTQAKLNTSRNIALELSFDDIILTSSPSHSDELDLSSDPDIDIPRLPLQDMSPDIELHLTTAASTILSNLRKDYGHVPVAKQRTLSQIHHPDFKSLALGQLKRVHNNPRTEISRALFGENPNHEYPHNFPIHKYARSKCTFCIYTCEWGVTDSRVWLPIDAFPGFCPECHSEPTQFFELEQSKGSLSPAGASPNNRNYLLSIAANTESPFVSIARSEDFIARSERITGRKIFGSEAERTQNGGKPAIGIERVKSCLDNRDVTSFQAVQTCRGNPWGQVDCRKAHICGECLSEKLEVVKHRRHDNFSRIILSQDVVDAWGEVIERDVKEKFCMICPGAANVRCDDCPLRLCDGCETILTALCEFLAPPFIH